MGLFFIGNPVYLQAKRKNRIFFVFMAVGNVIAQSNCKMKAKAKYDPSTGKASGHLLAYWRLGAHDLKY